METYKATLQSNITSDVKKKRGGRKCATKGTEQDAQTERSEGLRRSGEDFLAEASL
jgi:hypothetical protein